MIAFEDLVIGVGSFRLEGLDLELRAGEYAVLMGRTGSGKTTLLETLCGLLPPLAGRVRIGDRDVTGARPAERGIGYVPQDGALFPTLTVAEHLAFGPRFRRWKPAAIRARVGELAGLLGIGDLLARRPRGLSRGEGQRVALGRALAARPAVLLLDEPLSSVDEESREDLCALLHAVREQTGVTTLHVTHSSILAARLGTRVLRLVEGGILDSSDSSPGNGS